MKQLLFAILILATIQSNGQELQYWKSQLDSGKMNKVEYDDLVHGYNILNKTKAVKFPAGSKAMNIPYSEPNISVGSVFISSSPTVKYDTVRVILSWYDVNMLIVPAGERSYAVSPLYVVNGYKVTEEVFVPEHEVRDTPGEVGWVPSHYETKLICYLDPNKKRFSKNIKVKQW